MFKRLLYLSIVSLLTSCASTSTCQSVSLTEANNLPPIVIEDSTGNNHYESIQDLFDRLTRRILTYHQLTKAAAEEIQTCKDR